MADGLKAHTHQDRARVVEALIPLIKRHMGRELVALAASGSFAKNSDGPYSDIDLIGFVKRPQDDDRKIVNIIFDGMLIHIWFLTPAQYLHIHKRKINVEWVFAGSNSLVPLLNASLICELAQAPCNQLPNEYLKTLREYWPQVQEAAAKFLTAISRNDTAVLPILYCGAIEKICIALSFLNARPFTTRAAIFEETRKFPKVPAHFAALLPPHGLELEPKVLYERILTVFAETEALLYSSGLTLCEQNLDAFVKPLSMNEMIRRRFWINRIFRKVVTVRDKLQLKLGSA